MMKKYKYTIKNLDCPNCALKIEEALKEKKLENVCVNFTTSKISYESNKELPLTELNKLVKKIEPDCIVINKSDNIKTKEYQVWILVLAMISIGLSFLFKNINLFFIIIAYILLLYRPFINAIKGLVRGRSLNENALITISCIGAFLLKEHMEGLMVVFLYQIGKILEEKAINISKSSIKGLLELKQDYANVFESKKIIKKAVEDVKINDIIVIKKGEKIPLDGIVIKNSTYIDTSSLTGESQLVHIKENDKVLSGSINKENVIEVKVTALFEDSTISKILDLISDATDKKAKKENIVAKMSKYYTPIILGLAVLTTVLLVLLTDISLKDSIYRGLTFLVISCPCAIAISVPLSYFAGIGVCSRNGILIKGSNYLDLLGKTNKIVFDKTGTITNGEFSVEKIDILDNTYSQEEIIDLLVRGESLSTHPIAKAITKIPLKKIGKEKIENFQELTGKGITFDVENKHIAIGSNKLCKCKEDAFIHVSINNKHVASISMTDGIKKDVETSLKELRKNHIKTYLFTGDKTGITKEITKKLTLDKVYTEMLPQDKFHEYEKLHEEDDIITFVGDGINDAPLLKRADIGISMGKVGSDIAIEASDIVIMNDDIKKINEGIKISKRTTMIIYQNLIFAIGTKVLILLFSVFGLATMWLAVFADTGVTLLAILNTLRIMKKIS